MFEETPHIPRAVAWLIVILGFLPVLWISTFALISSFTPGPPAEEIQKLSASDRDQATTYMKHEVFIKVFRWHILIHPHRWAAILGVLSVATGLVAIYFLFHVDLTKYFS